MKLRKFQNLCGAIWRTLLGKVQEVALLEVYSVKTIRFRFMDLIAPGHLDWIMWKLKQERVLERIYKPYFRSDDDTGEN
jgi:hypothetical protein